MKEFIIKRIIYNPERGRVWFSAVVDGKKRNWTVARGLFDILTQFKEVKDEAVNGG